MYKYTHIASWILLWITLWLQACSPWKSVTRVAQTTPSFTYQGDIYDGWTLVRRDRLWGYRSEKYRQEIIPRFFWADRFHEGMALVQTSKGYQYVNARGKLLRKIKVPRAHVFSEGLAPVEVRGKWAYIDTTGKKQIKRQYDWAEPFHEGLAVAAEDWRKGYINRQGLWQIPPSFQAAAPFKNGLAIVRQDEKYGLIDTAGRFVLKPVYALIEVWEDAFYSLQAGDTGLYGLADARGKVIIPTEFQLIQRMQDRYIRVYRAPYFSLYDTAGKQIVPPEYDYIWPAEHPGHILVSRGNADGLLDTTGKIILPLENDIALGNDADRVWLYRDSSFLLMNNQLKVLRRMDKYQKMYAFSHGLAPVLQKDSLTQAELFGYIDRDGNEVIPPRFAFAGAFNAGGTSQVILQQQQQRKRYIIDHQGQILAQVPRDYPLSGFGRYLLFNEQGDFYSAITGKARLDLTYDAIKTPYIHVYRAKPLVVEDRMDVAIIGKAGKLGVIDTALRLLLAPEYDDIGIFYHQRLSVRKGHKRGFADRKFRLRIPLIYTESSGFLYGVAQVWQGDKTGIIDTTGRVLVPLKYAEIQIDNLGKRIYAGYSGGTDIYDVYGHLLRATPYQSMQYHPQGYLTFRQAGKLGLMDADFQGFYPPEFDGCGRFYEGMAWVRNDSDSGPEWGFINEELQLIIPVQYSYAEDFAAGFTRVQKGDKTYYLNTGGEQINPSEAQLKQRASVLQERRKCINTNNYGYYICKGT